MISNPLIYLVVQTWRFSKGSRYIVVLYSVLFLIAGCTPLFGFPWVWAQVIDIVQKEGLTAASLHHLLLFLLLPILIQMTFWALHGPARVLERVNAFKVRANYRKYLLQGIMNLPMEWHASHHSGDSIDKVEKGATALYEFSATTFEIIYALLQFAGSFAVLAYFSRVSAFSMLGMVALTIFIVVYFDRTIVRQYQELNRAENAVSESVFDAISNISTIITLRVEKLVFNAICHKVDAPLGLYRRNNQLNETKWFLTNMCATVTTALVLGGYFIGHAHDPTGILAGNVYLLINYLDKLGTFFFKFTAMYGDILQRRARVMNAEELSADFREENFANHILPPDWRRLSMEGLSFSYDSSSNGRRHLADINFEINRGQKIAFVGRSGSGKTTLLKIMRDLHTPQALKLSVDGVHAPEGFAGIARAITLVPQSPEIFATTVGNNITLGAEYDDRTVQRFLDMACFTDVVAELPKGLQSSINEKGVNLSGGQMQRLALTRGLLACENKDIVLLDEPTSSLDSTTEMAVYRRIFAGFNGKTIISSVHRLHLLKLFDCICLFEDGRIVAAGSLDELLTQNSSFQTLWAAQRHQNEN